jgi:prevent-host-death family protein
MAEITATEAVRSFSRVLDDIERHGYSYVITRSGRPVARLTPADSANGAEVKAMLARHRPDEGWAQDLVEMRSLLITEERHWPA